MPRDCLPGAFAAACSAPCASSLGRLLSAGAPELSSATRIWPFSFITESSICPEGLSTGSRSAAVVYAGPGPTACGPFLAWSACFEAGIPSWPSGGFDPSTPTPGPCAPPSPPGAALGFAVSALAAVPSECIMLICEGGKICRSPAASPSRPRSAPPSVPSGPASCRSILPGGFYGVFPAVLVLSVEALKWANVPF